MDATDDLESSAELDTDALDAVDSKRLTGPGAKAAKSNAEPKMSADVLGREKRSR
jgi:hypothetical protein